MFRHRRRVVTALFSDILRLPRFFIRILRSFPMHRFVFDCSVKFFQNRYIFTKGIFLFLFFKQFSFKIYYENLLRINYYEGIKKEYNITFS